MQEESSRFKESIIRIQNAEEEAWCNLIDFQLTGSKYKTGILRNSKGGTEEQKFWI